MKKEMEKNTMKNVKRQAVVLLLILCTMLSLTACGGSNEAEDVTTLVQGNIDVIYLGKYDSEYLDMVGATEKEAEQDYLDGLEVEAEYFANYWGIVEASYGESYFDLDESFRNRIIEMYRKIYSNSKYEIQPATKQDDGSYTVKVLIEPIDIMEQAVEMYENDEYAPLNDFWAKYEQVDFSTMSDEDYMAYTHEYGEVIVQMVEELIPNLGYKEQKSQVIQVEEIDGVKIINDDDWGIFDTYVIYYP